MKKRTTLYQTSLAVLLSFIFQTSFSQENYLAGYVISLSGDTVSGFVDYRNWERNPNKISFRHKAGEAKISYTPMEIRGFGVLDEIYESAIIETEISPVSTKDLKYNRELDMKRDTSFLQAMVKGNKSLYFYKNKLGKEQFYIRKDSAFELLVYKKYLKDQDGRSVIVENKKYIGQLTIYLGDCPSIQDKLNNASYQKNSLESVFLAYYKCTRGDIRFHKKTEKPDNAFGVIAGATLSSLIFRTSEEEAFAYLVDAGYNKSVDFTAGVFYDVILSRNNGKWSLCNELLFNYYKMDGRYDQYTNENKYTYTYTTLGYGYLKMNNMIRFKYPIGKFFLYLNGGISNGFAIIEKNYKKVESKLYTQERVEEGKALDETRRYELGFNFGLGTKFKKFSFEVRYEYGFGMSAYTYLKSTTKRFYFLLGYRF